MKYVISWFERPQGSPMEYENAQKRILEVFGQWKAPANFKIEFFVIRVGEWGGHMLVECDDPLTVHKFCSMLPLIPNELPQNFFGFFRFCRVRGLTPFAIRRNSADGVDGEALSV